MISFEKALNIALKNSIRLEKENVSLQDALYRVLAEEVQADRDMPPFNKSAVDGYACKAPEDNQTLRVTETIPAGKTPAKAIKPGTCSKIMTGAEVPAGADWVVMVEDIQEVGGNTIKILNKGRKSNIAKKAEDLKKGEKVLSSGTFLRPKHIGILASFGISDPAVFKQPAVNIIPTGNELVEPGQVPGKGEIRNSNASQLLAQFRSAGINAHYQGIVSDKKDNVREVLSHSARDYTLTVLTGGVSMGDYDFVPGMMEKAGIEILFHKIAIKPGKPTILGRKKDHLVIGLPGNPVSTFLQFELLIKPVLFKMMGATYAPVQIKLPLGEDLKSKRDNRDSWKPVQIIEGKIYSLDYHGSGHLHVLQKTDGFICIKAETERIEKNTMIDVRQF